MSRMTLPKLQAMKAAGEKSVCIVAWDYHMARIADRAGADIVSVGDSVGVNLWGRPHPLEVRFDELLVVAKAVRRGVADALVSCDFPFGPLQTGHAVPAAVRLAKEAGVDLCRGRTRVAPSTGAAGKTCSRRTARSGMPHPRPSAAFGRRRDGDTSSLARRSAAKRPRAVSPRSRCGGASTRPPSGRGP